MHALVAVPIVYRFQQFPSHIPQLPTIEMSFWIPTLNQTKSVTFTYWSLTPDSLDKNNVPENDYSKSGLKAGYLCLKNTIARLRNELEATVNRSLKNDIKLLKLSNRVVTDKAVKIAIFLFVPGESEFF